MTQQRAHRLPFVILLLCYLPICPATETSGLNDPNRYLNTKNAEGLTLIALTAVATTQLAAEGEDLEVGFRQSPGQARPHTCWFRMNGKITREGITADLKAMARIGIAGAMIFNVAGSHNCEIPAGAVDYPSPAWLDLVHHAASEAWELFDLATDRCEQHDRADAQPDRVRAKDCTLATVARGVHPQRWLDPPDPKNTEKI